MKIAFFTTKFPKLSETFILNQITGLIDRGHEVDVFAEQRFPEPAVHHDVEKYRLLDRTRYLDVPRSRFLRTVGGVKLVVTNVGKHPLVVLRALNVFKYGARAASLHKLYKTVPFLQDYDIIHCQYGPVGVRGASLKAMGVRGKLVTTFHGFDIRLGVERGGGIYEELFKRADCIVSISEYNRKNLVDFGAEESKIAYVPVGIDPAIFRSKWDDPAVDTEGPLRVVTVARLVKEKGVEYGIRAVHKLRAEKPGCEIRYTVIGAGRLEGELLDLTRDLDLEDTVSFVGARDQREVLEELRRSDVFLLPSLAEALPVCLMEAQSVGLPVIASDVGDVKRLVLDGDSGFVVPAGDPDAIAERLGYLGTNRSLWRRMGTAGRKHVQANYDIRKLVERLEGIYESLLLEDRDPD